MFLEKILTWSEQSFTTIPSNQYNLGTKISVLHSLMLNHYKEQLKEIRIS